MKKFVRTFIYVLLGLVLVLGISLYLSSDKIPQAIPSTEGDKLAEKMLEALDKKAWDDVKFLNWTFRGVNKYFWDKQNNLAVIEWDETKVILNLNTVTGVAYKGAIQAEGEEKSKAIDKAWANWCNDSFWMFAPFKAFDSGTARSVVEDPDGKYGLMVKYESGGVTPGDSYLWLLDENYIPTGYKMWVKIIPVGGTYFSWEDWVTLPSGAKLSTNHKKSGFELAMTDVKEANTPSEVGFSDDVFDVVK